MKVFNEKIYLYGDAILAENSKGDAFLYNISQKKWDRYEAWFAIKPKSRLIRDKLDSSTVRHVIALNIKIRVKSCDLSSKVFGFRKYKEALIGTKTNQYTSEGFLTKDKKDYTGYVFKIYSPEEDSYLSFCEEDLEFCIPNFDSYIAPKDRTVRTGVLMKPRSEKHIRGYKGIEKGQNYAVCRIVSKDQYTSKPNVVEVMNNDMVKSRVRVKHFKVI